MKTANPITKGARSKPSKKRKKKKKKKTDKLQHLKFDMPTWVFFSHTTKTQDGYFRPKTKIYFSKESFI